MTQAAAHDRHIAVLDGLRALAIALVLARHSLRPFWPDLSQPFAPAGFVDLGAAALNGWMGVDLFFVLSGFLITRQLLAARDASGFAKGQLAGYFRRRLLRIVPAYYFVLTLLCFGIFPFFPSAAPETVWGWRYLYHLLFLQDYFPPDICVVLWSLAIEVKFYLLAPLLVAVLMRLRGAGSRIAVLAGLIGLMAALRYATVTAGAAAVDYESYFLLLRNRFHLGLDGLLAGMLCAVAWDDARLRAVLSRPAISRALFWTGAAMSLGLLFSPPLVDRHISLFDQTLLFSLVALTFSMLMLGLLGGGAGGRLFGAPGLTPVARWSYSLYLIHLPLLYPAHVAAQATLGVPQAGAAGWLMTLPYFLAFSTLTARAIYRLIEKPFIRLSHGKPFFPRGQQAQK